jgi:molecular chaperone DnaJ
MKDPYKTLGINPDASNEEIKKAYKELALKWHPDRHQGNKDAEERFKEISEAYQLLKDGRHNPHTNFNSGAQPFINLDELFNQHFSSRGFNFNDGGIFGNFRQRHVRINRTTMHISMEDAHRGVQRKIQINEISACTNCKGTGFNFSEDKCDVCGGSGQIRKDMGAIHIASSCTSCKGFGHKMKDKCLICNGTGKITGTQEVDITIPAGTMIGQSIKPRQDLEIIITYNKHPEFKLLDERSGQIGSEINIDLFNAMLGNNININTLEGTKKLKISPNTQPGTILRIKNGGIGGRADHFVMINVQLPTKLTTEQKELVKKLQTSVGENNG